MTQKPNWQNNEQFKQLHPKKQKMILMLTEALQNKKLTEALPIMLQWKQQMAAENISFTAEENEILSAIFLENLSPAGRQQYEYLKPFIKGK